MRSQVNGEILKVYRADDNETLTHHFHNGYEMVFVTEGSSEFTINDTKQLYTKGTIIFINQFEQHRMKPLTQNYVRYVAILDPDYFDRFVGDQILCSIFKQRPNSFQHGFQLSKEDEEFALDVFLRCEQEYAKGDRYAEMSVFSNILLLLIRLYRVLPSRFPSASTNHVIATSASIQKYLDNYFLEDLTLEDLSKHFHLSTFYIMDIFKQVTGYTVKQYIILKRISFAKNQLFYTDKDISQIAIDSGFNSVSNFIRAFQKHEQITPLRYRKTIVERGYYCEASGAQCGREVSGARLLGKQGGGIYRRQI